MSELLPAMVSWRRGGGVHCVVTEAAREASILHVCRGCVAGRLHVCVWGAVLRRRGHWDLKQGHVRSLNSLEILLIVCLAPGAEKYFVMTGKGRVVGMV